MLPTKRISLPTFSPSPCRLNNTIENSSTEKECINNEQETRLQLPAKYFKGIPTMSLSSLNTDMYTPHRVKGVGRTKVGECPICYEEGTSSWFRIKISSYW
jgi:hypothetical protein